MSDPPRNMTLEHLMQAMASLAENNAAQGHATTQLLTQINERLASIDTRLAGLNAPAPHLPNARGARLFAFGGSRFRRTTGE